MDLEQAGLYDIFNHWRYCWWQIRLCVFIMPIITFESRSIACLDGGMSFHGGFLGVAIAVIGFCKFNDTVVVLP